MPTSDTGGASAPDDSSSCAIRELRPEQSATRSARRTSSPISTPTTRRPSRCTRSTRTPSSIRTFGHRAQPPPDRLLQQRSGHAHQHRAPVPAGPVPPGLEQPSAAAVHPHRPGRPPARRRSPGTTRRAGPARRRAAGAGGGPAARGRAGAAALVPVSSVSRLALQDQHLVHLVRERPGGEHPRDARADDDRAVPAPTVAMVGHSSSRSCRLMISSRPGPTPMAETRWPIICSTVST